MASVVVLGVLIGGIVAWHWKHVHYLWQDWRSVIGRLKRARALFWKRLGRGILVTVIAVIVLFAVLHL